MTIEAINLGTSPTGGDGDTARQAFEKVNNNFAGLEGIQLAFSAANFEANRARNNEMYAASAFVHLGNHESGKEVSKFKPGLYTSLTTPNKLLLGKAGGSGASKVDNSIINAAGVLFYLPNEFEIKFPQAPDGTVTYDKSNGEVKKHSDSATAFGYADIDPVNREVVTDRVDMWGFEPFLEEISLVNPFIYNHGIIHDAPATIDGIATAASARPVTYYAVYDGDTGSKGKGLNFLALSAANQKKVLSNPKHNLYYLDDGRLVQWRLRQRTIAGAGNGDWVDIDSVGNSTSNLQFDVNYKNRVVPQGFADVTETFTDATSHFLVSDTTLSIQKGDIGCFVARNTSQNNARAINGELYFLVCGTVSRLNQGAYHPSFNPMGARQVASVNGNFVRYWYNNTTEITLDSTSKCFIPWVLNTQAGYVYGNIGNTTGRPDGRFYDAIYADGQGGVCRDMRYSANGLTPIDFDEADLRVKNGAYRGFEKRKFTKVGEGTFSDGAGSGAFPGYSYSAAQYRMVDVIGRDRVSGEAYHVVNAATKEVAIIPDSIINSASGIAQVYYPSAWGVSASIFVVIATHEPYSVGGSFLQTDVIGDPANILQTDALKNGWEGSWIPQLPTGGGTPAYATRKNILTSSLSNGVLVTSDSGATWITGSTSASSVTNSVTATYSTIEVRVVHYQAFAKQTEPANNAEVYGGVSGAGNVRASSFNGIIDGCLLGESLTGNINKSANFSTVGPDSYIHEIQGLALNVQTGKLVGVNNINSVHSALSIAAPQNNSPAYKALDYNVNINQQGFKQYAATELIHDGTDWGDDGKVTIVDGESTKTDLNGNTVKVVTHKLKEPIGWIKNGV